MYQPNEVEQLLTTLLNAAQTLRIQQVQAMNNPGEWDEHYQQLGHQAWQILNASHKKLTALLLQMPYDRLFLQPGAQNYPHDLGRLILWCLGYGWKIHTIGYLDTAILVRQAGSHRVWKLQDHDGLLDVAPVNDPHGYPFIPVRNILLEEQAGRPLAWAMNVASWAAARIEGRSDMLLMMYGVNDERLAFLELASGWLAF